MSIHERLNQEYNIFGVSFEHTVNDSEESLGYTGRLCIYKNLKRRGDGIVHIFILASTVHQHHSSNNKKI